MTIELIDNDLKQINPTLNNFQNYLKNLMNKGSINDYLVVEHDNDYECYYQMDETEQSFFFTTVLK
jgi:hypothetical protein